MSSTSVGAEAEKVFPANRKLVGGVGGLVIGVEAGAEAGIVCPANIKLDGGVGRPFGALNVDD